MRISDLAVDVLKGIAAQEMQLGKGETAVEVYQSGLQDGQKLLAESILEMLQEEQPANA